jgi:hypothetical protein
MTPPGHFGANMGHPVAGQIPNPTKCLRRKLERKNIPQEIIATLVWFSCRRAGWRKILNHAANFSRPRGGSI